MFLLAVCPVFDNVFFDFFRKNLRKKISTWLRLIGQAVDRKNQMVNSIGRNGLMNKYVSANQTLINRYYKA